ncbi:oxidoreductase [Chlorella sorokiniana]|jgi:hypothetical protein|uniref:Oxidoreductase n=1 Tax=Chlorella sorokiniana TaxID=3076 RepID=A0A2P6TIN9_CHLSO|nr:oxidoreductase [Chlorella sorokiniana]|eukprot:PRW39089.1 oxidoreductase [Chlorella sorokiniana]
MQGVAAHDLIEHEDQYLPHGEARAALVGSPRARLVARARKPEPHLPSLTEKELGEHLRADPTERAGHPGVPCDALPAGHAHRLPAYKDVKDLQHPEDADAPLLVDVTAEGGAQQAQEQQEQQQ